MKIAFFDAKPYDQESFNRANRGYHYEITYFKGHLSLSTVAITKGYDAVCIFVNDTCDAPVIRQLAQNGVRLVALRCAGYNNVDLEAADGLIPVVRVPAYSPHAVAEFTVGLMLALNRHLVRASMRTRLGDFSLHGLLGFDMQGRTAGIVGVGRIAKNVIRILRAMQMRVVAYDPSPDERFAAEQQIAYLPIERLFAESDIVSLHCPLNERTRYIVNSESIQAMKRGVMIINTGRGQLIETQALIDGLRSRKVGSAALDVYEDESNYFFEDRSDSVIDDDQLARLLTFNNVIVTSHQAYFTREALDNIALTTLQNLRDFFEQHFLGNEIKNCVLPAF